MHSVIRVRAHDRNIVASVRALPCADNKKRRGASIICRQHIRRRRGVKKTKLATTPMLPLLHESKGAGACIQSKGAGACMNCCMRPCLDCVARSRPHRTGPRSDATVTVRMRPWSHATVPRSRPQGLLARHGCVHGCTYVFLLERFLLERSQCTIALEGDELPLTRLSASTRPDPRPPSPHSMDCPRTRWP